ncbi:hypothetical protein SLS62_010654 [Diatrype stigma]|uniref:tetrahydrofolate synthase n=1 Tax=Diatrype stigma TaxID=117547 RepID=A0AAN9YGP3_9PEZI
MRYNACVIGVSKTVVTRRALKNHGISLGDPIRRRITTSSHFDKNKRHPLTRPLRSSSSSPPAMENRTYEAALARLASLQSNLAVTSLFTPTPTPTPAPETHTTAAGGNTAKTKTEDLNALAIPEMIEWARRIGLDQPHRRFAVAPGELRCIHVAGTKGKGSVCAYLTSILTEAEAAEKRGREKEKESRAKIGRVGTYTSPHLVSVRERIQLDGAPIAPDLFARYFFEVWDGFTDFARDALLSSSSSSTTTATAAVVSKMTEQEREELLRGPSTKPFYFRFLTILAFWIFLREGVRTAVVECGIGAEYDPTNAVLQLLQPSQAAVVTASVVTQLGIDHVAMLGATVPEIAWHKAGVCKPGRRCFTRKLEDGEETMAVLRRRARERGAALIEIDDAAVLRWGGSVDQRPAAATPSLGGAFQVHNRALAVCAAREHMRVLGEEEKEKKQQQQEQSPAPTPAPGTTEAWLSDLPPGFVEGLRKARLRGRCEIVADSSSGDGGGGGGVGITWLLDGAHTAESLDEVARWFASRPERGLRTQEQEQRREKRKRVLIFNQQERDAAKMLQRLLGSIEKFSGTEEEEEEEEERNVFDLAIFTRNDMLPLPPPPRNCETAEPWEQRDLAVQRAAADAMRAAASSSRGTTRVVVVDNVAEAVELVRTLNEDNRGAHERGGGGGDDGRGVVALVTGSLHLVGAVLRTLEPDAAL